MKIEQSFWGRLLGYRRVGVHGTGAEVWRTPVIAGPVAFRHAIAVTRPAAQAAAVREMEQEG